MSDFLNFFLFFIEFKQEKTGQEHKSKQEIKKSIYDLKVAIEQKSIEINETMSRKKMHS